MKTKSKAQKDREIAELFYNNKLFNDDGKLTTFGKFVFHRYKNMWRMRRALSKYYQNEINAFSKDVIFNYDYSKLKTKEKDDLIFDCIMEDVSDEEIAPCIVCDNKTIFKQYPELVSVKFSEGHSNRLCKKHKDYFKNKSKRSKTTSRRIKR